MNVGVGTLVFGLLGYEFKGQLLRSNPVKELWIIVVTSQKVQIIPARSMQTIYS